MSMNKFKKEEDLVIITEEHLILGLIGISKTRGLLVDNLWDLKKDLLMLEKFIIEVVMICSQQNNIQENKVKSIEKRIYLVLNKLFLHKEEKRPLKSSVNYQLKYLKTQQLKM
jgi:hypothetical protein